ncbi:MAG: ribonuclease P protein component [Anaerolineae bacterium]|nr:ribonuclease P protein component [Anaerolineae bacterium]
MRSSARIAQVRRQGRSWHNSWVALNAHPGECVQSRFAFSVSRRLGNAVTRNRVRRRLRQVVRQYLPCIAPGWDVLILARTRASSAKYDDLARALADVLHQSRLWVCADSANQDRDGT